MTPAERMRERAAALAASRPIRLMTEAECVEARADLAAAIRALSLPEEAEPQAGGPALTSAEAMQRYGVHVVLSALPHLTGDDLRRVAEAMPRVAGEWSAMPRWRCWRRFRVEMGGDAGYVEQAAVRPHSNGDEWVATTAGPYEYTTHPTARAAQAACDARLRAAGVALCGEVVDG